MVCSEVRVQEPTTVSFILIILISYTALLLGRYVSFIYLKFSKIQLRTQTVYQRNYNFFFSIIKLMNVTVLLLCYNQYAKNDAVQ